MSENDKPLPPAATFSFLLPSGEILDRDGKPTGVTLQDQVAAAEARLAAYLAIDPELKNVPKEPAGPAQAALMELVRLLARRAAREWITAGMIEDRMLGNETKEIRKHTETASPQSQPFGDEETIKQPVAKRVKAVAGRRRPSKMSRGHQRASGHRPSLFESERQGKGDMGANLRDFEFVITEINRIQQTIKAKSKLSNKADYVYGLPSPSGIGTVPVGIAAARRFRDIAKRALKQDPALAARVDTQIVQKTLEHIFQQEILKNAKQLSQSLADKMVSRAIAHVRKNKLKTIAHFHACLLPDDPDAEHFSVGPVSFIRADVFLSRKEEHLKRYTKGVEQHYLEQRRKQLEDLTTKERQKESRKIRKSAQGFEADLRKYYKQYPWIAEIEVPGFERKKSELAASLCIKTALNILRLFFSWRLAESVTLGDSRQWPSRTASLIENGGALDVTVHFPFWRPRNEKGWVQKMCTGESGAWLTTAGSLVPYLLSTTTPLLYQRYINAFWWYGEAAAQEEIPHMRIISFCNALEAFLATKQTDISDQVARRAGQLLTLHDDDEQWDVRIKQLYDLRSSLVHGRIAAFDETVSKQVGWGTKIVRGALMEGLSWTLYLAQNQRPETLGEIHARLEHDLPRYCRGEFRNVPDAGT